MKGNDCATSAVMADSTNHQQQTITTTNGTCGGGGGGGSSEKTAALRQAELLDSIADVSQEVLYWRN